ncbi:MAG: potassium-transporting ATPase subunit KdpA [Phycisphaerales bacterium]
MSTSFLLQGTLLVVVVLALAGPLGGYMARVMRGERVLLDRLLRPIERAIYVVAGIQPEREQRWPAYCGGVLVFSGAGLLAVYALQRLQGVLPANPQALGPVSIDSSINTAISFVTNTNWQGYAGEGTMSSLTQMLGLAVQNFLSAATGIAVCAALCRALAKRGIPTIGNVWADLVRATLYILLPLSVVVAIALVSQGVVQSFAPAVHVTLAEPARSADGTAVTEQLLPLGPVASQIAIKQLGTNGGGYFNANSAHPFENPTPLSGFLELAAILVLPAATCSMFGLMIGDRRQGRALLAAMTIMLVALMIPVALAEQSGNPRLAALGVDQSASTLQCGGNMEGKEARFGVAASSLWAVATTAASNGSVNAMHDSFTPIGGLVPMWLMQLGEVVFGGVGSGVYGMLLFVIVAVFVAGLMVGRTPEYLGKKIGPFEMKMAAIGVLIPCVLVLVGAAIAISLPANAANISNPGPHGLSQVLYAYSSASNNNGSAFAGYSANNPLNNLLLGVCMMLGRFGVIVPVLALAGSMAPKPSAPASSGTLPTHTPLFVALLIATVVVVGALTFIPALALGPIAEAMQLQAAQH